MNRLVWELQTADNHVTRLQRERAKLDDGTHARAERDTLQAAFDAERATLNTLNSRRAAKEDELKAAEEKLARQNSRLMSAQNAHEVSAFQRDIAALTKARGELDEAILMLMDEAEASTSRLSDLEAKLRTAKAHASEIEAAFEREAARLKSELDGAVSERDTARAALSPAELKKYETVAAKHSGIAAATVEAGACSVCGTQITPFALREAKTREWPECEGCGRLLWAGP